MGWATGRCRRAPAGCAPLRTCPGRRVVAATVYGGVTQYHAEWWCNQTQWWIGRLSRWRDDRPLYCMGDNATGLGTSQPHHPRSTEGERLPRSSAPGMGYGRSAGTPLKCSAACCTPQTAEHILSCEGEVRRVVHHLKTPNQSSCSSCAPVTAWRLTEGSSRRPAAASPNGLMSRVNTCK